MMALACAAMAATAVAADPATEIAIPAATDLEEVVVSAPEPRYAAPTLRDRIGRVWAPVFINGKGPFRLVLDTGATRSAVIASVAERLGLQTQNNNRIRLHGVTGSAIVGAIHVDSLEVGELLLNGSLLPVVADVFGGAEGVLGTEGLADKRIVIDFGRDRVEVTRSHDQAAPDGFTTIPVKYVRGALLAVDARMGNARIQAIIDTGGQRTVGNEALRTALAKRKAVAAAEEEIIGVTLDVQRGDTVTTPSVQLGTLKISPVSIMFGDMAIFEHWRLQREPTLLIGMDVLGMVDMLILDYRRKELQIRLRGWNHR